MSFLGRESLGLSPFATRRSSLNRCWVQRSHRRGTSAGNEDSTEEEHARVSIQRSRLDFRLSASDHDRTEKIGHTVRDLIREICRSEDIETLQGTCGPTMSICC